MFEFASNFTSELTNFHLLRPWFLLALVPFAVACIFFIRHSNRSNSWATLVHPSICAKLGIGGDSKFNRLNFVLIIAIGTLAIFALSGPTWKKLPSPVKKLNSALVIAWDLSPSMYAQDIKPSRLERSKHKIIDILRQRTEGQTALIVYSGDAHIVTPLTDDVDTIQNFMDGLDPSVMPSFGSNIEQAHSLALNLLEEGAYDKATILFVTDGIAVDAGPTLARQRRGSAHQLVILGIGTEAGAPIPNGSGGYLKNAAGELIVPSLNTSELQDIAAYSGALYIPFSADDLDLQTLKSFALETEPKEVESDQRIDQWWEVGPYLLLPLCLVFPFLFRRSYLLSVVIIGVGLSSSDQSLANPFLSKDQNAQRKFEQGDFDEAAQEFERDDWKAAALYKNGEFEKAQALLSSEDSLAAQYNLANALAQQAKYEEAIEQYRSVLNQSPEHTDAQHNLSLLEEFLAKQEQNQQQQSDSSDQENSKQNQQKNQQQNQNGDNADSGQNQENQEGSEQNQDQSQEQQESSQNQDQGQNQQSSNSGDETQDEQNEANQSRAEQNQNELSEEQQNALAEHFGQDQADEPEQSGSQNDEEEALANLNQEQSDQPNSAEEQSALVSQVNNEAEMSEEEKQQQRALQALQRELNKIEDRPGDLLRRKFAQQSRERRLQHRRGVERIPGAEQRW